MIDIKDRGFGLCNSILYKSQLRGNHHFIDCPHLMPVSLPFSDLLVCFRSVAAVTVRFPYSMFANLMLENLHQRLSFCVLSNVIPNPHRSWPLVASCMHRETRLFDEVQNDLCDYFRSPLLLSQEFLGSFPL